MLNFTYRRTGPNLRQALLLIKIKINIQNKNILHPSNINIIYTIINKFSKDKDDFVHN